GLRRYASAGASPDRAGAGPYAVGEQLAASFAQAGFSRRGRAARPAGRVGTGRRHARENPGRKSSAALSVLDACSIMAAVSPRIFRFSENPMTQRIRGVLSPVVT